MKNLFLMAKNTGKVKRMNFRKKRGDKAVLIELGFAIVGVVLLVVFRDQITGMVGSIGTFLSQKIQAIFQ